MSAGFRPNGNRAHHYVNTIFKRRSISNSIGAPIHRIHLQQPYSKAFYSRLPHRKVNATEFSTNGTTLLSSISKNGFIGWYLGIVKTRPVLTKSITTALIYIAADLSSQSMTGSNTEAYDIVRTIRMGGYGLIILGPSLHLWFNFVSRVLPKRDLITTFKKMAMGQLIFGPIMTLVFFSVNSGLQGERGEEIIGRLKRDFLPTLINGAMYWPICDFINFRFIPLQLQPLMSNSFAYLWTIYMTYMASLEKADTTK